MFAKCQTCHVVVNEAGETLAGKGAKTGPNLYGIAGRTAGTYPEFKYGDSIVALGASGLAWNEADFVAYVADPAKFLKEKTGDTKAKTKMSFKLPKEDEALNVWAYLVSLAPAPATIASTISLAPIAPSLPNLAPTFENTASAMNVPIAKQIIVMIVAHRGSFWARSARPPSTRPGADISMMM